MDLEHPGDRQLDPLVLQLVTVEALEERLAALEGAEDCRATASGMAAIHTMLVAPVKPGDRIVAPRALFSSCIWILKNVMPKMGVEVTWVDGSDLADWERALSKPCRLVLIETPSNPMLDAVDIKAVADLTHAAGGELIVDNVFASPILQRPLELGADWVVYSTTKHMDGQGRTLGGAQGRVQHGPASTLIPCGSCRGRLRSLPCRQSRPGERLEPRPASAPAATRTTTPAAPPPQMLREDAFEERTQTDDNQRCPGARRSRRPEGDAPPSGVASNC